MTDKTTSDKECCTPSRSGKSCCRVEALLGVDERGQMVLPKDIRERANIRTGDKLALVSWEKDGEVCCLTLIKADALAQGVREFLGPVLGDLAG
ncbi:MAG: AbrB family transcriptional regulator [Deltaproteobacteria bacterium HGW-Deltaproteobacteria-19]|jgi:antitoxin PrlF|nr:MAG: AbrB family transcriptional regulator [Deltaproteobacteria bacterium HGW-Deltaproteobacteria-19]